jgi:hypothetical protein
MLQDKMGNIWFGTQEEGVFQYNGKSFSQHLTNEGPLSSDGFHHVAIYTIYQEKTGNIWFGQYRYDGKSFKGFPILGSKSSSPEEDIITKNLHDMKICEIIKCECSIAFYIKTLVEETYHTIKISNSSQEKLSCDILNDILIYLKWLSEASLYLAKKMNQEILIQKIGR